MLMTSELCLMSLFFFQAEDGIRVAHWCLEFRRVLFRSAENEAAMSHVRVATKYPGLTRRHFEQQGIQAECVKLNGAMELAPSLGLSRRIVDLVSSGATMKTNGLVETNVIMQISTRVEQRTATERESMCVYVFNMVARYS